MGVTGGVRACSKVLLLRDSNGSAQSSFSEIYFVFYGIAIHIHTFLDSA